MQTGAEGAPRGAAATPTWLNELEELEEDDAVPSEVVTLIASWR